MCSFYWDSKIDSFLKHLRVSVVLATAVKTTVWSFKNVTVTSVSNAMSTI